MTPLSPSQDFRAVIRRIGAAVPVVAKPLHGAILADTFRGAWMPIAIPPAFSSCMWTDRAKSLEIGSKIAPAFAVVKYACSTMRRLRRRPIGGRPVKTREEASTARYGDVGIPCDNMLGSDREYRIGDGGKRLTRTTVGLARPPARRNAGCRLSRGVPHLQCRGRAAATAGPDGYAYRRGTGSRSHGVRTTPGCKTRAADGQHRGGRA